MKTSVSTKGQIVLPAEIRRQDGVEPGQEFDKDSLIAATALTHGLVVATRNRTDFERAGVRACDPFEGPGGA